MIKGGGKGRRWMAGFILGWGTVGAQSTQHIGFLIPRWAYRPYRSSFCVLSEQLSNITELILARTMITKSIQVVQLVTCIGFLPLNLPPLPCHIVTHFSDLNPCPQSQKSLISPQFLLLSFPSHTSPSPISPALRHVGLEFR